MHTTRGCGRREFLKRAPLALAGAAAFPTIVKASALGRGGAVAPSDRIVMAGIGFGMQGPGNMKSFLGKPEVQWVAVCDLDPVPRGKAQRLRQPAVRQQGLRHLLGLPGAVRARRSRRRVDRGTRSLARDAVDRRGARRPRCLRREAFHAQPAGRARIVRRHRALRPRVADRQLAAIDGQLPPRQRARARRPHRQDPARRGRLAGRLHRFRQDVRAGEHRRPADGLRLRHVAWPGPVVAVLQGPRAQELALEHGLRRRPVDGLDRPPSRHRALGTGLRSDRPGRGVRQGRVPDHRHLQRREAFLGRGEVRGRHAHRHRRQATRRSRAARSGLAISDGCGSIAAASKASRLGW